MDEELVLALHSIGSIQFGRFKLKSGTLSPFYLDLRILVSHPRVLRLAAQNLSRLLGTLTFDRIAAIPYSALPIGTAVALEMGRPLIYPRRERKDYGTERAIEGVFQKGELAVVLDDVITTGASKMEAIEPLISAGLKVQDVVVLIDREQGGVEDLARRGYQVHALSGVAEMMQVLAESNRISKEQNQEVLAFLQKQPGSPLSPRDRIGSPGSRMEQ
jgi:orotate phosphoribosyltransferase